MSDHKHSMQKMSVARDIDILTQSNLIGRRRYDSQSRDFLITELADAFLCVCKTMNLEITRPEIKITLIDFFFEYLPKLPPQYKNIPGSTSVIGLLPLFLSARAIRPDIIIESGLFVGSSLHLLRYACPQADIYGFDINLNNLVERLEGVKYFAGDWSTFEGLPTEGKKLAFFDDHINCALRINQCKEKNVEYAIFDDSPAFGNLYKYLYPSIPSVHMIMDASIPDMYKIEWRHENSGINREYIHDARICNAARDVVSKYANLDVFQGPIGVSVGDKWITQLRN